ncbi:hypothetical protein L1987_11799 [Smallanthus sonchifolius]|uniref:Uncharacterized protein n=1 Tax=Smallanthus sonchifolius TaxID=185202 RepID=A0ACB9JCU5_9ASTR|nr:hypothetical protein L1987_11799 [Smallanthus sonchifolius]
MPLGFAIYRNMYRFLFLRFHHRLQKMVKNQFLASDLRVTHQGLHSLGQLTKWTLNGGDAFGENWKVVNRSEHVGCLMYLIVIHWVVLFVPSLLWDCLRFFLDFPQYLYQTKNHPSISGATSSLSKTSTPPPSSSSSPPPAWSTSKTSPSYSSPSSICSSPKSLSPPSPPPRYPIFSDHQLLLTVYVSIGALIGLILPVAYIVHGVLEGDKEGIKAAAPHVFLLSCQVLMEAVTFSGWFSLPVRVFVPVVYNAMRMYAILDWVKSEVMKGNEGEYVNGRRLLVGRGLAMGNMVFWGFNLFGFLLPVYLPKAFKKYFADKDKDS